MGDDTIEFKPEITVLPETERGELHLVLSGDNAYGFDKSLVNAIRRVILTEIPSIAFNIYDNGENNDIIMVKNNTSLHNEMLFHRISMIPLYIKPDTYMKHYLFECKVKHDSENPYQFVTMNDVDIYPLKSGILERIEKFQDESYDYPAEDERSLRDQLNTISLDNYDMDPKNKLSQKDKDKIFRPFQFRNEKNYSLITELKSTNSEDTYQELHFYGSPSIGIGKEHAKFQGVSQSTYTFLQDEELIEETLKNRLICEGITDEREIELFKNKFMLAESERYFHRDDFNEPNQYNFLIKSNHYYDSETLFKKSIALLIEKCENLKLQCIEYLKEEESTVSVEKVKEYVYHYGLLNETHTLGNLIQSHITRRSINDTSILTSCGYKSPHPLEENILLIVSLNPNHKLATSDEVQIIQGITTFLMGQFDEIMNDLRKLYKVSEKTF